MKLLTILLSPVFILLTFVEPIWADELWDQTDEPAAADLHLNPRLNLLAGVGDVGAEGHSRSERWGGGATLELGQDWRRLETGALLIPTGGEARSRSFALPMWAKFRVIHTESTSWFVKAGGMSAFEMTSARDQDTRNVDVLASGGVGGRVRLGQTADLIIDVTYNRGLLDHSRAAKGIDHQSGALIFTGLSFPL